MSSPQHRSAAPVITGLAELSVQRFGDCSPLFPTATSGPSPLSLAAARGDVGAVARLLQPDLSEWCAANAVDDLGRSPLWYALSRTGCPWTAEQTAIVGLLLRSIVAPSRPVDTLCHRDRNGVTPLHVALGNRYFPVSRVGCWVPLRGVCGRQPVVD